MAVIVERQKINMRVAAQTLQAIDEAAAIQGVDRTAFVIDAAATKARRVILEEQMLNLTHREVEQIKALLESDAEPTLALAAAAARLKDLGL